MSVVLASMLQVDDSRVAHADTLRQIFGVDWSHLTAQIISFSIVCALLYAFAYKPVLAMLAARRAQIAQGLANTEKINARLADIEAQRQGVIAGARDEASQLVAEARGVAKRLKELEAAQAVTEAGQIVSKAREAAELERTQMLNQLCGEVGRLVVQTTAAVAGRILTADDHRRLAEATARELAPS